MREELKNQLISHLPLFIFIFLIFVVIFLPEKLMVYGMLLLPVLFIVQGLVYLFKKNIYFRFCYISKSTKIISGLIWIATAILCYLVLFL